MDGKAHTNSLDELNAGIAQLREELAALAAYMRKPAGSEIEKPSVDGERPGFWNRLGEAGARGEKAADGLAHEIERHPLIGGLVAFGLGFLLATLLFRRSARDSGE